MKFNDDLDHAMNLTLDPVNQFFSNYASNYRRLLSTYFYQLNELTLTITFNWV